MSNTNTGGEPQITPIKALETFFNFGKDYGRQDGLYDFGVITSRSELTATDFDDSLNKTDEGVKCRVYLESLETRMIEAEKRVKELEGESYMLKKEVESVTKIFNESSKRVKELEEIAKEVSFIFGNYPDKTIGKELSNKAKQLLTPKQ